MKFKCEKIKLLEAVEVASNIVMKTSSLLILSSIYLEIKNNEIIVKFTNLKSSGIMNFLVDEGTDGKVLVKTDKLLSILRKMDNGYIECGLKKNYFYIRNEENTVKFKMDIFETDINSFPSLPKVEKKYKINVKQNYFLKMINNVLFAVSKDDSNQILTGVYLEKTKSKLIMTATSGKRLSNIFLDIENKKEEKNIIIPYEILNIIKNYLKKDDLSLFIDDRFIYIEFDNYKFYSSLINGEYVSYDKIISVDLENKIIINRKKLKKAIDRVSLMIDDNKTLYLEFEKNKLNIKSKGLLGEGNEIIDCEYNGEKGQIVFNYNFIYDPISIIEEDFICIKFNSVNEAVILKGNKNNNSVHVIEPMIKDKNE